MGAPQAMWQWHGRLGSAFRTVLACTIVGCITLYGPESVRGFLAFPAFSYVTTILIVSDATLGDAMRGCWQVFYASIQVMLPSMLSLWLIGPAKFSNGVAAMAVALSSFAIALPGFTHLLAKRIAFGQTVIVYVGAVIQGAETDMVMHPIHVASSSALVALASIMAMLFPYPQLAYSEVRKASRFYAENASNRLNLLVEAFLAQDNIAALNLITEARLLSTTGAKLLRSIKDNNEGMLWEKPRFRFLKTKQDLGEKLHEIEMPIQGMELALSSCSAFPIRMVDEELQCVLQMSKKQIALKLEQAKCLVPFDVATAPETKGEYSDKFSWTKKAISTIHEDLSPFFFLYCMELLQDPVDHFFAKNDEAAKMQEPSHPKKKGKCRVDLNWCSLLSFFGKRLRGERMVFATKCSLSLGLAVMFGLIYNKENGYWSGLTIAISFVTGRQATFTMANARAQGTAMGSIYGILCCFFFQQLTNFRFLLLLPWIVFTSFLRHSRMYGQAGGISAVIGALLILGRRNYGTPSEFAIARITEATIGLICFIMVEIILQPVRAATLAKRELSRTFRALQDCFEVTGLYRGQKGISTEMREKQKKLKSHVSELGNFIAEAELEPNFWFVPFNGGSYNKLLKSISKMADLLSFVIHQIEFLSQASQRLGITWEEIQEPMQSDLQHLMNKIGSLMKSLDEALLIKSNKELEKELQMKNATGDLELGKSENLNVSTCLGLEQNNIAEIVRPCLQHPKEVTNKTEDDEVEERLKNKLVLCLSSLGFCINNNLKIEVTETEKEIGELLKWENSGRQ